MNRNKKLQCTAFLICLLLLLSSCQLALPDGDTQAQPDPLIGVYITLNYIDTVDMETFFDENADSLVGNMSITGAENDTIQNRIYADTPDGSITFPGLEGMLLVSYWRQLETEGYWTSYASEGLQDIHNQYYTTDTGTERKQTANIYIPYHVGEICFYMNPVYMTEDQQIYLLPGTGSSMSTDLAGEMRQTLSEEVTRTVDGVESRHAMEVEIIIDCVDVPDKVVLTQMDENNQVLLHKEYLPASMPETVAPEKNTAYILIEEYTEGDVMRSIHQPGDDKIAVFVCGENNICTRKYTEVAWPEQ